MKREEFSNGFDVLVSSYKRFKDFDKQELLDSVEFNEYEKSVFLTKAQEEIVLSLYNGKNPYGEAFEGTEELRRYLSNLITEKYLKPITNTSGTPLGLESKSKFFTLPEDLWFITLESVVVDNGKCKAETVMKVYPVKQDEYQVIRDNPFRGANDRRALRLDLSESNVEIICKYMVAVYYIRYIKKVPPIILEDLPNDLTIEGKSEARDCILHETLHQKILERAVQIALQSKGYSLDKGNRDN